MDERRFEQIQDYLNGQLEGKALVEFEALLDKDAALKAEVELNRDIDIALMDDEEIPFMQTLRDVHTKATESEEEVETPDEETPPGSIQPRRRILRYAAVAAAAILLLLVFQRLLFPPSSPPPNFAQISMNTIGNAPTLELRRSTDGTMEINENLVTPYQKIKDGKYDEATPELTKIYEETGDNQAALGLGYCHLQVKKYDKAIEIFKQLEAKNAKLNNMPTWYLAHSHLRKGDIQESKNILRKFISINNVTIKQREQAKNLLNSLEKMN